MSTINFRFLAICYDFRPNWTKLPSRWYNCLMKIVFVTPWYGEIPGGMEAETRQTAEKLTLAGIDVEVWTTCIRDFYAEWDKNYHPAGVSESHGVKIHRFRVGKRDKIAFDQVNIQLMHGKVVSADEEQIYMEQMINCPDLYRAIAHHRHDYWFIFIPYLFSTTYLGAQIAPNRSLLIPCLHDEAYARMEIFRSLVPTMRGLILHSYAELHLVEQIFGASSQQRLVLGEGIDTDVTGDAEHFRETYQINTPFILYAGRRETGKNTPLLLNYWGRFVRETGCQHQLILIGSGDVNNLPPQSADLGFVPRQAMYDAMKAAELFCLPSTNESFSRVIMESWLMETPVLVHGECAVTVEHCQRSNGGLYFANYNEFKATLNYLITEKNVAQRMGQLGRNYVLEQFAWPKIIQRYVDLLQSLHDD